MTKRYYKLTEISKTGYELVTSDIEMIYDMLDQFVCNSCKVKRCESEKYCQENSMDGFEQEQEQWIDGAFPEDYDTLPTFEKVNWLMSTACGCEFMFEEFESYHDYAKSEKDWFEEYLKKKENLI